MGIFKAVGGALNQLSEFLTTAERNKQIKEGVANGELMEVHQAWGRLRKRTTKHANGWRVRLNPKKLRRKRQTRQETALI